MDSAVQSLAGPVRLQRLLADAGVASRRECERMIEEGRVEVNGQTVTRLPVLVDPQTVRVRVDGKPLRFAGRGLRRVYVMLNKPDRTLTTTRDTGEEEGTARRTVLDLVDHPSGARLYPVGRLDYGTTGLVLLTNDGDLTNRLTHARYGVGQTYRVWAAGRVTEEVLAMLRRRVGLKSATDAEGNPTGGVQIDITPGTRLESGDVSSSTVLEVTVRPGKREAVADVLMQAGCPVKKIVRVGIGPLRMAGVGIGRWRDLSAEEVQELRESAFPEGLPRRKRVAGAGGRMDLGERGARMAAAAGEAESEPDMAEDLREDVVDMEADLDDDGVDVEEDELDHGAEGA